MQRIIFIRSTNRCEAIAQRHRDHQAVMLAGAHMLPPLPLKSMTGDIHPLGIGPRLRTSPSMMPSRSPARMTRPLPQGVGFVAR